MTTPGSESFDVARAAIERWYDAGLRAVDARAAVRDRLHWDGSRLRLASGEIALDGQRQVVAIAIGKAASGMASGLVDAIDGRIGRGIILTKDGHADDSPKGWEVFEASHPVPDHRGVQATQTILDAVTELERGDVAIVLVSGGGSALLEAPRLPLSLADIQETTRLLLNAGAPIQHLNAVRSELSLVKGGGLRRAIGEATCVSLILSDVLGNDPAVIASGPTLARDPDPAAALGVLDSYQLIDRVPQTVMKVLRGPAVDEATVDASRDRFVVIGDNEQFIRALAAAAGQDDRRARIALRLAEGEARNLAERFIDVAENASPNMDVVIGGGEATVTVRGDGTGGRNTEFSLAAAILLEERKLDLTVASLASDGQDGLIDAAGAVVDRQTVAKGRELGLEAGDYLERNDSGAYFQRLGLLVEPGPTGTNVNDVYVAVRTGSA